MILIIHFYILYFLHFYFDYSKLWIKWNLEYFSRAVYEFSGILQFYLCFCLCVCVCFTQGNLSFSCVEPRTVPVFFNATSYLEVPGRPSQDVFSVSFLFRTWNPNGLLVFSNFADDLGNVEIDINEGKVSVHINVTQIKKNQIDISSGKCFQLITILLVLFKSIIGFKIGKNSFSNLRIIFAAAYLFILEYLFHHRERVRGLISH